MRLVRIINLREDLQKRIKINENDEKNEIVIILYIITIVIIYEIR